MQTTCTTSRNTGCHYSVAFEIARRVAGLPARAVSGYAKNPLHIVGPLPWMLTFIQVLTLCGMFKVHHSGYYPKRGSVGCELYLVVQRHREHVEFLVAGSTGGRYTRPQYSARYVNILYHYSLESQAQFFCRLTPCAGLYVADGLYAPHSRSTIPTVPAPS